MKIMTFSLGNKKLRYEFSYTASKNVIDSTFRKELDIPSNVNYSLIGMLDDAIANLSSLIYLENESNIIIHIKEMEQSTTNNSIELALKSIELNLELNSASNDTIFKGNYRRKYYGQI